MIFFFDRNIGRRVPEALKVLKPGFEVEYHQRHFDQKAEDDEWLGEVGGWGWIVISQDNKFHLRPNELDVIRRYDIACFYLQTAHASNWDTLRLFAIAYPRIVRILEGGKRPFIYWVRANGRIEQERI